MLRLALLLLFSGSLAAAEPKGIIFPDPPPTPKPAPTDPSNEYSLAADELLVFQSDAEVFTRQFPSGGLNVTVEKGPLTIRSRFYGGGGKMERKTFPGPFVYLVEPAKNDASTELLVIPSGLKADGEIRQVTVKSGKAPQPPPPGPTPEPDRKTPIPGPGLKVMIVFENEQVLAESQNSIIYGQKMRAYLNENCVDGGDGKKSFRIFDQNTPVIGDKQIWADAMKRPRSSVPWIVIGNEATGTEVPLPATVDETIKLIQKYGGK